MGGFGSGNYLGTRRRFTVEESLVLAVVDFAGNLRPGASGGIRWTRGQGDASVGYGIADEDGIRVLRLGFRWRDEEDVTLPIRLQPTTPNYGGRRWWFTWPLAVDGVACARRARNLYPPPVQRHFGCRHCFQLTSRSSQQAHKVERTARTLANLLGADPESTRLVAERWCR